jgi:biotin synthase
VSRRLPLLLAVLGLDRRHTALPCGRERNLREWQALALYPANSIFVRGYLTTPGQSPDEARRMIEEMGFEAEEGAAARIGDYDP